ncbi:MAG: preprotein translocase subunit SecG [Planctomycetales bacterium]|nr:preprotein translocase subunit SecG [Planctomycetales bacterium]
MLFILSTLIFLVSLFLIVLILIQRGRGGGLAGAFGGAGGQSAFGTKAGDMFTKITAGAACVWILLCAVTTWYVSHANSDLIGNDMGGQAAVTESEAQSSEAASGAAAGDAAAAREASDAAAEAATGTPADASPSADDSSAAAASTSDAPADGPTGIVPAGDAPETPPNDAK